MKVVVTATGDSLDDQVDTRFGRCAYFLLVEVEGDEISIEKSVSNEGTQVAHGAGPRAAQAVGDLGAKIAITGNVGPNATSALQGMGIEAYAAQGTVKDAVEKYQKGELQKILICTF